MKPKNRGYEESEYNSSLEMPVVSDNRMSEYKEEPQRVSQPTFKYNKSALTFTLIVLAFIILVAVGSFIFTGISSNKQTPSSTNAQKIANYGVSNIPLSKINPNQQIQVGTANLAVNGQLEVNKTLVLTPGTAPTTKTTGQIYYDQTTNQPYYYNGSQSISLAANAGPRVNSLGGATGSVSLGNGLSINANNQLNISSAILQAATSTTPVVTLTAGNGIALVGTAITNNGVISLNGLAGGLTLQNATASGSAITINDALADGTTKGIATFDATNFTATGGLVNTVQGISTAATPQFAGLSLTGDLTLGTTNTVFANNITQTASGNPLNINAGSDQLVFYANGGSFEFPTSPVMGQTICTTGITCASGGGQAVILESNTGGVPTVQTNATAALPSIFINNTGGAELLKLQGNGADTFTVAQNGTTTIAGTTNLNGGAVNIGTTSNNASVKLYNNTTNGTLTLQSGATVGNLVFTLPTADGSGGNCLKTNGVGILTFQACTGGAGGGVTSINGQIGVVVLNNATATGTNNITINSAKADGSTLGIASFNASNFSDNGAGVINTKQDISSSASPTFTGLTVSGIGTGVVHATSGVLSVGNVALGTQTSGNYVASLGALTGLATTGNGVAGATPTLAVQYGSGANTAVQGNITLVCPSASGNLGGGGNTITLGSGGTCNAITLSNTPTFGGLTLSNLSTAGIVTNTAGGVLGTVATIGVSNGGTGVGTFTSNGILYGNGTGTIQVTSAAANSILATNGSNVPGLTQTLPATVQGNITAVGVLGSGSIGGTFGNINIGSNTFTGNGSALTNLNGSSISSGTVSNSFLTGSGALSVIAGTGLSGGGSVALGGSTTLSVSYGSGSGQSVQGSTTIVCPSGSGNITGVGNTITLGAGGTCNGIGILPNPTFTGTLTDSNSSGVALNISGTPQTTVGTSLIQIGSALDSGSSNASGTYIGVNEPSSGAGSASDFINLQSSNLTKFLVDSSGKVSVANGILGLSSLSLKSTTTSNVIIDSGTTGSILIGGDTSDAKTISIGPTATNASQTNYNFGINTSGIQNINVGSTNSSTAANAGTTVSIQGGTGASGIMIGTTAAVNQVTLGSTNTSSVTNIQGGTTGGINLGSVGSSTLSSTTHIADTTNATGTQTVTVGSNANAADATNIQGGSTGGINIGTIGSTATASTIHIADTTGNAIQAITIGGNGAAASSTSILAGSTGGINLGTVAAANGGSTINIANTSGTGTQAVSIGSSAVAASSTTIQGGSTGGINIGTIGSTATASTIHIADTTGNATQAVTIGSYGAAASSTNILGGSTGGINLGSVGSSTQSSTINVGSTTNATGTQTVSIGSAANIANATNIQGGTTGGINLGSVGSSTLNSTTHIADTTNATGTQTVTVGSNANAADTINLVGANVNIGGSENGSLNSTPALDGSVKSNFSSVASTNVTVSTTKSNDVIVLYVGSEGPSAHTVTSVTSSHLTWTKRKALSLGADHVGQADDTEEWWAPASSPLSSEVVTVTLSNVIDDGVIDAFGVNNVGNYTSPWDSNVSLPATATGTSTPANATVNVSTSSPYSMILGFVGNECYPGCTPTSGWSGVSPMTTIQDSGNNGAAYNWSEGTSYQTVTSAQTNLPISMSQDNSDGEYSLFIGDALSGTTNFVSSSPINLVYQGAVATLNVGSTYLGSTTNIQGGSSGGINIGTGTTQETIGIGNTNSATATNIQGGSSGGVNIGATGSSTVVQTVNINNSGAAGIALSTNIGTQKSTSTVIIQGGVNGTTGTIQLNTFTNGYITIGTNATSTIQIGTIGSVNRASTVQIANSTAGVQTVSIGSNSTGSQTLIQGGTTNVALQVLAGSGGTITVGSSSVSNTIAVNGVTTFADSNSSTGFQIQDSGSNGLFTADTNGKVLTVGTGVSSTPALLVLANSNDGSNAITEKDGAIFYNSNLHQFICGINSTWVNCASGSSPALTKNAPDTSTSSAISTGYLYGFSNNSSTGTGVLSLNNNSDTGVTLNVTASANPADALIVASNTYSGVLGGNLIDLQSGAGSTSVFKVNANGSAFVAPSQGIDTNASGLLDIGSTNATSIQIGNSGTSAITTSLANGYASAYQIQNASTSKDIVTIDSSANQLILGTSGVGGINGQLAVQSTSGGTLTLKSGAVTAGNSYSLILPTTLGNLSDCLELGGGGQLQFGACGTGTGLGKNAHDSSTSALISSGYLYDFTNNSSSTTGVLHLDNSSDSGNTLYVTTATNPTNAVIVASDTNASPSGKLLDLQSGSTPTSVFNVSTNSSSVGTATISAGGTYTSSGSVTFSSSGTNNAVNIDTGAAAAINIGLAHASSIQVGAPIVLTPGGNAFQVTSAPTASTSNALIDLSPLSGNTFSGSSSGTYLGVAAPNGYAGDLINLEVYSATAGAEVSVFNVDSSGSIRQNGNYIYNTGSNAPTTTYNSSAALTLTDILVERFAQGDPTSAAISLTTPSAASIVGAINHAAVGDTFTFVISNAGTKAITFLGGSNVTVNGTTTPTTGANITTTHLCRVTAVPPSTAAVICY